MPEASHNESEEAPAASWRRRHRVPLLVGLAAALLGAYGLMWGLPNIYDVAADSVVPNGELAGQTRDFARVTAFRYPPLHFDLLRLAFLPADVVARTAYFAGNLKLRSTVYIWIARAVSFVMGVGLVMIVYALTLRLFGRRAAVFAALTVTLCPITQYYTKNANLDIPYTFWFALSLLALERFFSGKSSRPLLWAALAATAAVCTKDQAYGCFAGLTAPVLVTLRKRQRSWGPALLNKRLWLAAGAALLAFALIHRIPFGIGPFVRHVREIVGPASEGWRETTSGAVGWARLLVESILWLAALMTPAGVALAGAGAVMAVRQRRGTWLLWSAPGYGLTFLAVIGYVYPRFLLPAIVTLAPFAGLALDRLWGWRPGGRPAGVWLAGAAVAWTAAVCAMALWDMDNDTRRRAQFWIEENVAVTQKVGYLGHMRDMPRLNRSELEARRVIFAGGKFTDFEALEDWRKERGREPTETEKSTLTFAPDVLLASVDRSALPGGSPINVGQWLVGRLGSWGRQKPAPTRRPQAQYPDFTRVAVFAPDFGRFTPDVSPSFGRVLTIYRRQPGAP